MKHNLIIASVLVLMSSSLWASGEPAAAGKSAEELAAPCAACHGPAGVSPTAAFPTIAGQHKTYLAKALEDYRSGARKNAIMAGQAANLSDADIKKLAAYFSKQEGPLYTPTGD